MDLFDTHSYPRQEQPGYCMGCGKILISVTGPAEYRESFRRISGKSWPGVGVYYRLYKDFTALGLDTTHVPEEAPLCLVCAVDYMLEFNRRNKQRREKEHGS